MTYNPPIFQTHRLTTFLVGQTSSHLLLRRVHGVFRSLVLSLYPWLMTSQQYHTLLQHLERLYTFRKPFQSATSTQGLDNAMSKC
jgi:hypothetical protein